MRTQVGRSTALIVLLAAGAAGAIVVRFAGRQHVAAHFVLKSRPAKLQLLPGQGARFQIAVERHGAKGPIYVQVADVPRQVTVRLGRVQLDRNSRPSIKATIAAGSFTLTGRVSTGLNLPPATYHLRFRAWGPGATARASLTLVASRPRPAPFSIRGGVAGLQPGAPQALDLSLTNPNRGSILVTAINVSVLGVSAPNVTWVTPCGPQDFSVAQFSGVYPLTVPAQSTVHLSDLGVSSVQLPELTLLNRPVDQDGCQGASVNLGYTGTARTG